MGRLRFMIVPLRWVTTFILLLSNRCHDFKTLRYRLYMCDTLHQWLYNVYNCVINVCSIYILNSEHHSCINMLIEITYFTYIILSLVVAMIRTKETYKRLYQQGFWRSLKFTVIQKGRQSTVSVMKTYIPYFAKGSYSEKKKLVSLAY